MASRSESLSSRSGRSQPPTRGTSVMSNSSSSRYSQQHQQQHQEDDEPVDLHELAKGWKAAINRATNPKTR